MAAKTSPPVQTRYHSLFGILFGVALLASVGCGKKADVTSEISDLEKSFKSAIAAAPAQPAPNPSQAPTADGWVDRALTAARANDYVGGVVALQSARSAGGATAEQLMAVQRTMGAMTSELATRAAKGDAKAKADLAAIERTRSQ